MENKDEFTVEKAGENVKMLMVSETMVSPMEIDAGLLQFRQRAARLQGDVMALNNELENLDKIIGRYELAKKEAQK